MKVGEDGIDGRDKQRGNPHRTRFDDFRVGTRAATSSGGPSIIYAETGHNLIQVTATDTAGNTSAPATVTISF